MVKRFIGVTAAVLTGLSVLGLGFASAGTGAAAETSIKDVMKKLNGKGASTESAKLRKSLAAPKTDWESVQASTKVYAELGPELQRSEPPKGDKAAWMKTAEGFASQTKALNDAAEKKDLAGTKSAFQKISTSCMGCHRAHKG